MKTSPHFNTDRLILSGTQARQVLHDGQSLPLEYTRSEVTEILIKSIKKNEEIR